MAIVVTFRLPTDACASLVPGYGSPAVDGATIKSIIKPLIEQALTQGVEPTPISIPPTVQTERINLSIRDAEAKRLREIAKTRGIPESIVCQQLMMTLARREAPIRINEQIPPGCELLEEVWRTTGRQRRVAQAEVYIHIKDALSDGQIALVEASTGVGKTLAMLCAAEERLRTLPDSRVVIAVPTIAVMQQFARAHRQLADKGFPIHRLATIVGRREFVSRETLLEVVDHPKYVDQRPAILSWINLQGEALDDIGFDTPWLTASLRHIAPGFPVEACVLPDSVAEDDPGYLAYLAQFAHEEREGQEILLCTHAMLSISTRQRHWAASRSEAYKASRQREIALMLGIKAEDDPEIKAGLQAALREHQVERLLLGAEESESAGKLPPFRYLLVDEAHLLENAMSAANASYLSIHSLVKKAEACHAAGVGVTAAKLASIRQAAERVRECSFLARGETVTLGEDSAASVRTREALTDLLDSCAIGRLKKKDLTAQENHLLRQLEYGRAILKSATQSLSASARATVRFSPVRDFPQLYVGSSRVDNLFQGLWASVKAAACISATLYIPRTDGYSSNYQRRLLAIPDGRGRDCPPVAPLWMYTAVAEVRMPPKTVPIRPPSRAQKLTGDALAGAEQAWLSQVAAVITQAHETAVGGTLVLMTSYDSIRKIQKLLPAPLHALCVFASLDAPLLTQSIAFLKLADQGKRPIWFATGGAWTGLDIGGHEPLANLIGKPMLDAADDNILTDLIIPRLPFGINKSVTHEYRIQNDPRTPWEILDMLFRLKQGIGRLVRREGLPANRRITLLDSRIYGDGFDYVRNQLDLILRRYPNRRTL